VSGSSVNQAIVWLARPPHHDTHDNVSGIHPAAYLQAISKTSGASILWPMRTGEITDEQWERLEPFLPPRRMRGRPRADDRRTLNGILYVLRTGCRWEDVPPEYGSSTTCWRRLRAWEEDGTWEGIWRSLLALLDEQEKLAWAKAFLDASFDPAKKGELASARPSAARVTR
jgi:transposase